MLQNCTALETVTIPNGIERIYGYAFRDSTNLTKVTIPVSVSAIYEKPFENCENLTIYGYTNSYAETFANDHSIPFVSIGTFTPDENDINGDGILTYNNIFLLKSRSIRRDR